MNRFSTVISFIAMTQAVKLSSALDAELEYFKPGEHQDFISMFEANNYLEDELALFRNAFYTGGSSEQTMIDLG